MEEDKLPLTALLSPLPRLVDYLALVEFDKERLADDNVGAGIVTQRFPRVDREDAPFPPSLAAVSRPQEWRLTDEKKPILYHVEVLTDLSGRHQFACALEVQEKCTSADVIDIESAPSTLYKPKVFVLVSRHSLFRLFAVCLHKIATTHCHGDNEASEVMMATLLEGVPLRVDIPVSFTLADQRLSVRAAASRMVPVSDGCVALLARSLGIHGLVLCMRAVLSEQKVLLLSSYTRMLSAASWAINSLLYPFEYSFTQITILPAHLLEYLESPTPFLMGIMRESYDAEEMSCRSETVIVDLDTGRIEIPTGISVPNLPEKFELPLISGLQTVMYPELRVIDMVSPPPIAPQRDDAITDSLIRAAFTRFYADILEGYRNALLLVRVYPNPHIDFHHAAFLGFRNINRHPFTESLLNSHLFQLFVASRGLPFRPCDIFDQEISRSTRTYAEGLNRHDDMKELADEIYQNERQDDLLWQSRLLQKAKSDPLAEPTQFDENRIDELCAQLRFHSIPDTSRPQCRIVPNTPFSVRIPVNEDLINKQKKALEECYSAIRDGRIAEARKKLPSAEITLRNRYVRVKLCSLLVDGIYPVQRATLQPQQFELIVRLINCALDNESQHDEHGIAYACLHFAWVYSRHLTQGVQQYLYTCIQDHPVWKNERFWESAFFHDVHRSLRSHYISQTEKSREDDVYKIEGREDTWGLFKEPSAMELVAKRLMQWKDIDKEERKRLGDEEESIIFGAAKHYINLMIYLRIPLDTSRLRAIEKQKDKMRRQTASSDESSEDEGYVDDGRMGGILAGVTKSIQNVVERLSSATGLSTQQVAQLTRVIPECIDMHVDTLEQVYIESSKLPPPPKLKISDPELCENERMVTSSLRCFLLNENDREITGVHLPAEGALFLTNYRVIFKGHPVNPFNSDETVIRSAPVMSIVKEKSMDDIGSSSPLLKEIPSKTARTLHHCIQMRTSTFACITLIFDEESTLERIAEFAVILKAVRWPIHLPSSLVCYADQAHLFTGLPNTEKSSSTMNDLRKAITRLPNKMGTPFSTLLPDNHSFRKKDMLRDIRSTSLDKAGHDDFLDISGLMIQSRLSDYSADLRRLRFDSDNGLLRVSKTNKSYDLVASYPSQIVVPSSTSDEILPKIAKGFKSNRLPVVTWVHERGAMLVRGAAFSTPNVVKRFKKQAKEISKEIGSDTLSMGGGGTPTSIRRPAPLTPISSSAHQQETYLRRLVACSPTTNGEVLSGSFCSSTSPSQESLKSSWTGSVLPGSNGDKSRKASSSAVNFMRANTARASLKLSQVTTSIRSSEEGGENRSKSGPIAQRSMYIFGEKGANKLLRLDKNIEFIPVQFPTSHDTKESFKRFLKVMKPSASSSSQSGKSYLWQLEESRWMDHIALLLQTSSVMAALLSHYNSSVVLAIEEGRDATCQISSLVQIIADPHYRTFDGLQRLISKEWLAFGHRFSYRSNHSLVSQKSGYAPVFIMFLDALHQLMRQNPSAFEYNDFLLRFLAYHSQSTFFRTFIMDSESERCAVEKNVPDTKDKHCIWRFIKEQQARSPLFTNFEYNPQHDVELEPRWSQPNLQVWPYYTEDFLSHGPPYDIDACLREIAKQDEERAKLTESKTTVQETETVVKATSFAICGDLNGQNAFVAAFDRLREVCSLQGKDVYSQTCAEWRKQVDSLDAEGLEGGSVDERLPRRSLHAHTRRAVMKYLVKGKNPLVSSAIDRLPALTSNQVLSPALEQPELEDRRGSVIDSRVTGKMSGESTLKTPLRPPLKTTPVDSEGTTLVSSGRATPEKEMKEDRPLHMNGCTPVSVDENAFSTSTPMYSPALRQEDFAFAHSGILFKKGATFKFWKQRWFVLDHRGIRMLYYDTPQDSIVRGEIELMDLESIDIITNVGVPRKGAAVLEIRTSRRSYSLMANSVAEAEQWRSKIAEVV